jgi:hypothetical protein
MSVKDQFTAEEWESLAHGPFLVSMSIGMSDPSGPFGMMKESMALAGRVKDAIQGEAGELTKEVAADLRSNRPSRADLIGDHPRTSAEARINALEKLRAVRALATAKGGANAAPYIAWLASIATAVAEAGKEGGFLGIGGEAVSADEATAIAEIKAALGAA